MMCHRIGFPPISTIGFGRKVVSSERRDPNPPARMTTFTAPLLQISPAFISTTLSVWLMGLRLLRYQAVTLVLSGATNAVFQGFLTKCGCLKLLAPNTFPLKINRLVILTK